MTHKKITHTIEMRTLSLIILAVTVLENKIMCMKSGVWKFLSVKSNLIASFKAGEETSKIEFLRNSTHGQRMEMFKMGEKTYEEQVRFLNETGGLSDVFNVGNENGLKHTLHGFQTEQGVIGNELTSKPFVYLGGDRARTRMLAYSNNPAIKTRNQYGLGLLSDNQVEKVVAGDRMFDVKSGRAFYLSRPLDIYRAFRLNQTLLDPSIFAHVQKNGEVNLLNKSEIINFLPETHKTNARFWKECWDDPENYNITRDVVMLALIRQMEVGMCEYVIKTIYTKNCNILLNFDSQNDL